MASSIANAKSYPVVFEIVGSGTGIHFDFLGDGKVETEVTGEDAVMLDFDYPIQVKNADKIWSGLSSWLRHIQIGYHTIFVQSRPEYKLTMTRFGRSVTIKAMPRGVTEGEATLNSEESLAIALAKLRLHLGLTQYPEAYELKNRLLRQHPTNAKVWQASANAEGAFERTRRAVTDISRARDLDPKNPELVKNYKRLRCNYCPGAQASQDMLYVPKALVVRTSKVAAGVAIAKHYQMGAQFEFVFVHGTNVPHILTGEKGLVKGAAWRTEAYGRYQWENGNRVKLTGYFHPKHLGAGLLFRWWQPWGYLEPSTEFNRAYWGHASMIKLGGARDQIGILAVYRLPSWLLVRAALRFNRYFIKWAKAFNTDIAPDLELKASIAPDTSRKYLGINSYHFFRFRYEAAYMLKRDTKQNDYEKFTLGTGIRKIVFSGKLSLEGFLGSDWSRMSKKFGLNAGAQLGYNPMDCLSFGLGYGTSTGARIIAAPVHRFFANLDYRY